MKWPIPQALRLLVVPLLLLSGLPAAVDGQRAVEPAAPQITWNVQTVSSDSNDYTRHGFVIDASGQKHMTFQDSSNAPTHVLKYARSSGAGWQVQTVDSGLYTGWSSAIALDPGGGIVIAYADSNSVMVAKPVKDGWELDLVEAAYEHLFEDVGIGFDGAGAMQVGYADWDTGEVKYARYDEQEDRWEIETVTSGSNPRFHVDSGGTAHFVYVSGDSLMHATRAGSGWMIENLGSGFSAAIAWKEGEPCLAYQYAGHRPPGLYYRCGASGTEVPVDRTGSSAALGIGTSGAPHIVYRGDAGQVYTVLHGSGWISETVQEKLGSLSYAHVVVDGANRAHLSYKTGSEMRYARTDGTIVPDSELVLAPQEIRFVAQLQADTLKSVLVTRAGEPVVKEDTFEVALQVRGKQAVDWEVKAPGWIVVQPAKGTGPAKLRVGLNLQPDDVKSFGVRRADVMVQSTDGKIKSKLAVTAEIAPRRYIPTGYVDPLIDYLVDGLGYTEHMMPPLSTRPRGTVLMWSVSGNGALDHSTVVLDKLWQIGMRDTSITDARIDTPKHKNGLYHLERVFEPPGSFEAGKIPPYLLAGLPSERPDTGRQWNCHGYAAVLAYYGWSPTVRLDKGAVAKFVPGKIKVDEGRVWYGGASPVHVDTPLGPFDVHSECTVEVGKDGAVIFHLYSGSATYHGASGDLRLLPSEFLQISTDGHVGRPTYFDPSSVFPWWAWVDGGEEFDLHLPAVRSQ